MFSGIVEEVGVVENLKPTPGGCKVGSKELFGGAKVG